MYKHYALDSINEVLLPKNKKPNVDYDFIKAMKDVLKSSVSFHMGDVTDLYDLVFKNMKDDNPNIFSGEAAEGVNLPYDNMWIDFRDPVYGIVDRLKGEVPSTKGGILVINEDADVNGDGILDHFQAVGFSYFDDPKKWMMVPCAVSVRLNAPPVHLPLVEGMTEEYIDSLLNTMGNLLTVVNMFLKLINCKNIVSHKHTPPKKINKKRKKRNKLPLHTYHTLRVNKPGVKIYKDNVKNDPTNSTRIHLCRGHFKTYTVDKPLFGSITGTYWWQPSVRGNKEKGIVNKDYEVRATV